MFDSLSVFSGGWWAGVMVLAAAGGWVVYFAGRPGGTPDERERWRRLKVHVDGRITDGTMVDHRSIGPGRGDEPAEFLFYEYRVGGVEYSAAQDVSTLMDQIGEPSSIVGVVHVKYQPRNPSNSIIICEEWNGFRNPARGLPARDGSPSRL